ncbi:MAG: nitroreductase/quinone reductase family protein [Pseudomonadales bacterium]
MVELRIIDSGSDSGTNMPAPASEPRLILITQGRESGRSEAALLRFKRVNNDFLVIASNEKSKRKPDWYLNLKEQPCVRIEVADAAFNAKAWTPTGAERVRLLPFVRVMLDSLDSSIPRETSVILLSPLC